jgi:hypothetical protein
MSPREARGLWLALGLVGVAVRLWLWWVSFGSTDVLIWGDHGSTLLANGLSRTYEIRPSFNHPPLLGLYVQWIWSWTTENGLAFARAIKLPGLAGEALTFWALWRFAPPRAFAVYALAPAPILVASYHGNTDCLYAALVLVAAIAFDKERYFLSGVLWGATLNVKLLPLALLPIVVLGPPHWRAFLRLVAGASLGLIPFIPPLLTSASSMYRNMITYNSNADNWGLLAILNLSLDMPNLSALAAGLRESFITHGRYLILASVAGVALLSRLRTRLPMTEQAALGASLFLFLAPGFGVQYVVFALPLICFVSARSGFWWGWSSGIFIGVVYWIFIRQWQPPLSLFTVAYPGPAPALGMLAWAVLAHFLWTRIRAAWQPPTGARTGSPS